MCPPDTQKLPTLTRCLSSQPSPTLPRFLRRIVTGWVREPMYWYRVGSVSVQQTAQSREGRADSIRPYNCGGKAADGSTASRLLPGSKAFDLQQPTGYHLFTIHSYLLPSPTQVGDAGQVRALVYRYKVGSVSICGTALPAPGFLHVSNRAG